MDRAPAVNGAASVFSEPAGAYVAAQLAVERCLFAAFIFQVPNTMYVQMFSIFSMLPFYKLYKYLL